MEGYGNDNPGAFQSSPSARRATRSEEHTSELSVGEAGLMNTVFQSSSSVRKATQHFRNSTR